MTRDSNEGCSPGGAELLSTSVGDFPLNVYRLKARGNEWSFLHVNALLSREEETEYLLSPDESLPYGITLWASSVALAHDLAERGNLHGRKVLELGAGTGLPGIIAASNGALVVQTDSNVVALSLAGRNALRNGISKIEQRKVDWKDWDDDGRYDWIIGSDILYSGEMHPYLREIFESNLAPGGRILLSDPFRATSLRLLTAMEEGGWNISMGKWSVGEADAARAVGVFELSPPPIR